MSVPPLRCIICLLRLRPMPDPLGLVVKKRHEYLLCHFIVDARPVVGYLDVDALVTVAVGFHGHFTLVVHSLNGILQQVGDHLLCNAKYIETSVVKLSPNPTKILPERKQKQQSYSPARSARAIPCMRYSTQGTATLFPSALYLAESDAPGMSVQPGG